MSKRIDMVGKRYGKLVVTKMIYNEKRKNYSHCECVCDCGNVVIKDSYRLRNTKQEPSCGCNHREIMINRIAKNVDGMKFGKLTILESIWSKEPMVKCLCDCGNIVVLNRNSVITGHTRSCGCLQKETMTKIRFQDDSGFVSDFGNEIIRPYKRNKRGTLLWECKCGNCGNSFYAIPAKIKNNSIRSCGCISKSSMEKYIEDILDENCLEYKSQYKFDDCLSDNGYKLRFDFAVMKGGKVLYLIEYDGKQHFEPVDFFGGEEEFQIRKRRDYIKDEYCKNNNIPLLRLPYYLKTNEIKDKIMNILNP